MTHGSAGKSQHCPHAAVIFCLLALTCLFGARSFAAAGKAEAPIFVLHSYAEEYPWTRGQHQGFIETLNADPTHDYDVRVESLDSKRVAYTPAYANLIAEYIRNKYAGYTPAAIYVTDDNALRFALGYFDTLFPGVPVFFSGINDYTVKARLDPGRFTGVFEKKEISPNLELIRAIAVGPADVLVIGDASETYRAIREEVGSALNQHADIHATFISSHYLGDLLEGIRKADTRFIVLTTLGSLAAADGRTLTLTEILSAIAASGDRIILSMEDAYLHAGVLGGWVTSGPRQGRTAAELLRRYMAGAPLAEIAPIEASPNEYILDDRELNRIGLVLPPGVGRSATHIHGLPGFYESHRRLVLGSLYSSLALVFLGLIIALTLYAKKNRLINDAGNRLRRLNQAYAALAHTNRLARHTKNELELFEAVCRLAVEEGGMRMAWIGVPGLYDGLIRPVARFGLDTEYLDAIEISIDPDIPQGRGPTGVAFREGRPVVLEDFMHDPSTLAWQDSARIKGNWSASASFPIFRNHRPYAVFSFYHADNDTFDDLIVSLFTAMSADIGFVLDVFDKENTRRGAMQALSDSEKRFQLISTLTSDLFYYCRRGDNGRLRIGWISGNAEKLFGCTIDEMKSLESWDCFVLGEDLPIFYEHILNLRPRQTSEVNLRIYHRDGSLRYLNSFARLEVNEEGDETLFGALKDITEQTSVERRLFESETRFHELFNLIPDPIFISNLAGDFIDVNDSACFSLGHRRDELIAMGLAGISHAELGANIPERIQEIIEKGNSVFESVHVHKHGAMIPVEINNSLVDIAGERFILAIARDLSERKLSDEKLRLTSRVFESTLEGILITDARRRIIDVNHAFTQITGYSREEALGQTPRLLKSGQHDDAFYAGMWEAIHATGHWSGEIWNRRKNGELYPEWISVSAIDNQHGETTHYVGISSDISVLKQHEKQLEHIAHYDALTGIPNRVLLGDRMQQALAQTRRDKKRLAICYLDLDGFKPINDTLGHEAGDTVLIKIAERIGRGLRGGDTVARLGGDEFVILLLGIASQEDCHASIGRLLEAIEQPITIKGEPHRVTASIGVTLYPNDDQEPDTLLRHADQAMYLAKQSGKNRYHIFDPQQDSRARINREFCNRIEQGLAAAEFHLFYQPKVTMSNRRIVGAEALIRWRHPERGLLSPYEFLPAIENSDLEIQVGEWVIEMALAHVEQWLLLGIELEISINISAAHLQYPGFIDTLRRKLAKHPSFRPRQLQIEILETAALADIASVSEIIEACSRLGVGFALDDFGTGYSSLAYLRKLPADTLKIDQSFVRDMLTDKGDYAIVQGIIALARTFNRTTVAEGVETEEHFRTLLEMGCEIGQGYGIARPMPAEDFLDWCAKNQTYGGAPATLN